MLGRLQNIVGRLRKFLRNLVFIPITSSLLGVEKIRESSAILTELKEISWDSVEIFGIALKYCLRQPQENFGAAGNFLHGLDSRQGKEEAAVKIKVSPLISDFWITKAAQDLHSSRTNL